ncbi:MAG TPA: succinylglutamate desuccinylase/aspartoacylase family protein [Gemmatimonadaceae bacterium]|nr:succinylglutamate desuccinylase/aspartoacylase family protein [Gemmatimonadaceae bacterium]
MPARVQIRDIVAQQGERAQGWLTIGETSAGPLRVPLVIINGQHDGPTLCLTAGVHAAEYAPIDAAMRLIQSTQPGALRGVLIVAPVVNMRMFEHRAGFVSPLDGLNLNKIAPGRKDGSISEILADVLLREVIGAAEYHVDLHAGDIGELLLPFGGYSLTGNAELDRKGEALARAYSPHLISLATDNGKIPPFPGSLNYSATRNGVVSILAESGGNGTLEEADVQVHVNGVHNIMRYLGMLDGGAPLAGAPRIAARDRIVVRATRSGLLRLLVGIGDEISKGQELAQIRNVFGEIVEVMRAPGSGIAGLIWTHKVVNTGDPVVRYWITEPA